MELSGHDHIADFRFSDQAFSPSPDGNPPYIFHNLIIAPSLTMSSESTSGYLAFNLNP